MNRASRLLLAAIAAVAMIAGVGCAKKVTTVQQRETVHESQPKMVSPGTEVVE